MEGLSTKLISKAPPSLPISISSNLPVLKNDTNNVIEFNDGFSSEINNDKPRSFWNLLKSE